MEKGLLSFKHFLLANLVLIFNSVFSQTFTARPGVDVTYHVHGYYEYLPEGYDTSPEQKYPLLIFIHGVGELGDGTTQLSKVLVNGTPKQMNNGTFPKSFTVDGQTFRFIAIIPQFKDWPAYYEPGQIIDYAIKKYRVDTTRIYLTGLSMGGGIVWSYVGSSLSACDRIAAVVPVCGAQYPNESLYDTMAVANLPVWATHNSGDPTVPSWYTDTYVDGMNNYKLPPTPRAKKTIFQQGGHDAWTKTYDLNFRENGVNVYEWMLQYSRGTAQRILPVQDLKFMASQTNNEVVLKWTTSGESGNKGFAIERSTNGQTFDSIGFIPSSGEPNGSYSFQDNPPSVRKLFYRLKIVAATGEISYSNILPIEIRLKGAISIFPNPVGNTIHINTNYSLKNAKMFVFDMSGKLVTQKVLSGEGNYSVPLHIPAGMYSLALYENGMVTFEQSFLKR